MKDCKDCRYNDQGRAEGKEDRCRNPTVVLRQQHSPRCNIERKDGYCGEMGFFFQERSANVD